LYNNEKQEFDWIKGRLYNEFRKVSIVFLGIINVKLLLHQCFNDTILFYSYISVLKDYLMPSDISKKKIFLIKRDSLQYSTKFPSLEKLWKLFWIHCTISPLFSQTPVFHYCTISPLFSQKSQPALLYSIICYVI
jgi:hypothetical protein